MEVKKMTREEFKTLLEIYIMANETYNKAYALFIGGTPQALCYNDTGLFSKLMELSKIIKKNSIYAEEYEDDAIEEYMTILFSEKLSSDKKVDMLYKAKRN